MFLKKISFNTYQPPYPSDEAENARIKIGDEVRVSRARNPMHHRKFFAILHCAFENQDKYDDMEIFRQVVLMKSGHVVFIEGTDGKTYPLPKSISFDKCSQDEFETIYGAALQVLSKEMGITVAELENESQNYL